MKKIKLILSLIAVFAFVSDGFGQVGLAGSAHDFTDNNVLVNGTPTATANSETGTGWNNVLTDNQMCGPCHEPHNAPTAVPLWTHATPTLPGSYAMYDSPTMEDAAPTQPAGISLLCLGCHDGTVGLDAHNGATGNPATNGISGSNTSYEAKYNIGQTLSNDHPISITYNTADAGLRATSTPIAGAGTIADHLYGAGGDQLECASCHDVHNKYNIDKLLISSNANSALCLDCHNK